MNKYATGLILAAACAACGGGTGTPDQISGTITSRDGMNIAPNASVRVELVQSTNGQETIVRDTTFQLTSQQAPIQFTLNLAGQEMKQEERYLVRAHIMGDAGQPMYSSSAGVPVTAATAANVEVEVLSTGGGGATGTDTTGTDTTRTDTSGADTTGGDTTRTRDTSGASGSPGGTSSGGGH